MNFEQVKRQMYLGGRYMQDFDKQSLAIANAWLDPEVLFSDAASPLPHKLSWKAPYPSGLCTFLELMAATLDCLYAMLGEDVIQSLSAI